MSKFESAIFLIKNGYVDTRYHEGKFQVKMTQKGKDAYLLLNRLKELSK
jgi:predicted transcriptional regulator